MAGVFAEMARSSADDYRPLMGDSHRSQHKDGGGEGCNSSYDIMKRRYAWVDRHSPLIATPDSIQVDEERARVFGGEWYRRS